MNNGTNRDILQGKCITYLRGSIFARNECHTYLQTIRSNDISFLTISVEQQSDTSRTVGIVFNCLNHCGNTVFLSLEIDESELSLVTATHVAHGHLTNVVTTAGRVLTTYKRFFWYRCSNLFEGTNSFVSLPRCCGLKCTYCHFY